MNEGISSTSYTAVFGSSTGNDETGEPGWSIGDTRLSRADSETHSWYTDNSTLLMTIKGTAVPCDGIWCATLTVRDFRSSVRGCDNVSTGNKCTDHLSDDDFTHAMTDYSVDKLYVQSDGQLQLWLQPVIATGSKSLVLHVSSETFAFKDANVIQAVTSRVWNNSGLSWTTGDAIGLKLTDAANATGDPTIDGVPQVGMMLAADTSDIEDVDGLPATFTYQWVRVAPDSTETDLGTNSTLHGVVLGRGQHDQGGREFHRLGGQLGRPASQRGHSRGGAGGAPMSRGQRLVRDHDRGDTRSHWDILWILLCRFLRTA